MTLCLCVLRLCVSAFLFEIKTMPFQPAFDPLAVNSDCGEESDHLTDTKLKNNVCPPPLA